jgi:ribose transport system permease protein
MITHLEGELYLENRRRFARGILNNIVWLILILCIVIFSSTIKGYFSIENYINILSNSAFIGILAVAESFCLISGNMDLSVESIAGYSAIFSAWLTGSSLSSSGLNLNPYIALVLCLLVGVIVGFVNSYFILKFKINAFLVTLSTYIIIKGLAIMLTGGAGISMLPNSFRLVDTIKVLNISLIPIIMMVIYIIFHFILKNSQFGAHIFIIGGNINAAYNFGVNVNKTIYKVFILSGILSALSGWLMTAKANGANPTMSSGMLFEVLAAVVLGGVSLQGGVGSLPGVFAGVLVLSSIRSALNIMSVSPFVTEVIRGLLVFFAIIIDSIKKLFFK